MGTQFSLPPDTRAVGTGNPPVDMNDMIDAHKAQGAALNVLNTAYNGGADPTGGADSTAAFQQALNAASAGQSVYAPAGTYLVSSPIVIPPYVGLRGDPATSAVAGGGSGTKLVAASTFTAGSWPVAAVILIVDQTTGGYATQSQEQHVRDIMIDGSALALTSTMAGITIYSAPGHNTGQTSFENILIYNTSGWGFSMPNGSGQIRARAVICEHTGQGSSGNPGGFQIQASDCNWQYCSAQSTGGVGWSIQDSYDSSFFQIHSEHNAGDDLLYLATYNNSTPDAGGIVFHGITIDAGEQYGIHLTSTGSNLPPVSFHGGFIRRCGTTGTYASVFVDGYAGPVHLHGLQSYPGQPDGGGSQTPAYALKVANCGALTNISVDGGTLIGVTGWLNCDGSQGLLTVSGNTAFGQGTGSGTTVYTPGIALQAAASAELLPVDTTLFRQSQGCLATSMDRSDASGSFSPATGIPYWRLVTLFAGVPVTAVCTFVTGAGKTGGSHGWAAISSVATGLITAVSADQTDANTTWGTANNIQEILLTAQYVPPVTGPYWLGFCVTATGMPTVASVTNNPDSGIASMPPILCGASASHSSPPSVGAAIVPTSGVAGDDFLIWAA